MSIYADTSLVVSLYLLHRHSAEARRRMVSKPVVWLAPLHRAEWAHAIERHVFQSQLSRREAEQVYADFDADRTAGVCVEADLPELAFGVCAQLARRRVARLGGVRLIRCTWLPHSS